MDDHKGDGRMRDQQPTVRGRRVGSEGPSYPIKDYVYNGDDPWVPKQPKTDQPCAADDCAADAYIKGYCNKHYRRLKIHGTPDAPDQRRKENK